jgi:hypothetical protein
VKTPPDQFFFFAGPLRSFMCIIFQQKLF